MSWVMQRYSHISPVTLQVGGGAMRSSLFCGEVEGLSQVESFLVELYRCKLCQFTCGLKTTISSHLLKHRPPTLPYLGTSEGGVEAGVEADAGLQRGVSPYQLDLNTDSKQSDEDEEFLLYNMLDNMSPPTCDISNDGGLQVAHTCEVSTLFEEEEEEESSIFPLKRGAVDLSCPSNPTTTQEEMAQSAHLMTLGLCRISAAKPPPPAPASPSLHPQQGRTDRQTESLQHGRRRLCLLCPLTLPSRRLLDIHVRSHRAGGGFSCVRCSWTADSWEELEPHWMGHWRRKSRKKRRKREDDPVCRRTKRKAETQDDKSAVSDKWRAQTDMEEAELPGRKFSSKLTLRRHLGIHGGEKPFTCPHCSYSTRLKASLLQHLRTHTGEKPYRCSECPYASIDHSSLLRHRRTHSQERPYRCPHCDYSSIQKKSLGLHSRRHHTGEVFSCQQCEYSSPDRQLLQRHIRRRHTPPQHATAL
ncbi:uncharacterized protein FYW49_008122 isoform 2-T2 [Xenentodon cancila]